MQSISKSNKMPASISDILNMENDDENTNENFLELQHELTDTETKIQATRQFYNTVVMGLNTQIQQFPSNIVARMFGITPEKLFEIDESERANPHVSFK